jgi:hypothetical protein
MHSGDPSVMKTLNEEMEERLTRNAKNGGKMSTMEE